MDYHRGEEDLRRGRVRFVGDARHRLREDHQRILRYFRFRAQLSSIIGADDPYDSDTLEVLREEGPGLKKLAGMRIWPELKKILNFKGAGEEVKTMWKLGLFPHCGLPIDSTQEQVGVIIQFDMLFTTGRLVPPCRITIVTTQLSCSLICQTIKCSSVPHSPIHYSGRTIFAKIRRFPRSAATAFDIVEPTFLKRGSSGETLQKNGQCLQSGETTFVVVDSPKERNVNGVDEEVKRHDRRRYEDFGIRRRIIEN